MVEMNELPWDGPTGGPSGTSDAAVPGALHLLSVPKASKALDDAFARDEPFRDVALVEAWKEWQPGKRRLCVISKDHRHIEYLGVGWRVRPSTHIHVAIRLDHLTSVGPVDIDALLANLSGVFRDRVRTVLTAGGGTLPPGTTRATLDAIRRLDPQSSLAITEVLEYVRRAQPTYSRSVADRLAEVRDGVNLSRRLAGLGMIDIPLPTRPTSIVEGLTLRLPERTAVANDMRVFGDWPMITQAPAIQFMAPRERYGGGTVTVIEVGDSTVETATGVDLVYHNEVSNSWVLVQYKRIDGNPQRYYLSDPRLERQREAIRLTPVGDRRAGELQDVRIGNCASFLKVCKGLLPLVKEPVPSLIDGLYLPIDLVEALIESGTTSVSYVPVPTRHMTNTEFIALVQGGWIGTRGEASREILDLVSKLLGDGARILLASGRRY